MSASDLRVPRDSWFSPKIEVRESHIHGKGTFARERIEGGEVVEVWGERVDGKPTVIYTSDRKAADAARAEGRAVMQWDANLFSIEEKGGDDGYFLNHSCDSNLWLNDAFTLVARRPIQPGEELTLDYALFESDESLVAPWRCGCNTSACRKVLTGRDWMHDEVQARYAGHFSPLIEKKIARAHGS